LSAFDVNAYKLLTCLLTYVNVFVLTTGYVVYSASTSFFIPFLITFVLYARIFVVLRRRMAAMRMRRHYKPEMTSSTPTTTVTVSSIGGILWRLRRRKLDPTAEPKSCAQTSCTLPVELSDDKSSSNDPEVIYVDCFYFFHILLFYGF